VRQPINWVLDLDVVRCVASFDRAWLERFLQHRIGDRRLLRRIQKWLKAGGLEDHVVIEPDTGVVQGAVVSPLLAHIYRYYVLDLWAHQWRRRHAQGAVIITRYADGTPVQA
jgi:retron-type reverse transcriptase